MNCAYKTLDRSNSSMILLLYLYSPCAASTTAVLVHEHCTAYLSTLNLTLQIKSNRLGKGQHGIKDLFQSIFIYKGFIISFMKYMLSKAGFYLNV